MSNSFKSLLMLIVFLGCFPAFAKRGAAYDAGYNDGLRNGKNQGYMEGLREGQNQGRREGDEKGKYDGQNEGFAAGKRDGEKEGKAEGLRQGKQDGQSKGEIEGRKAGEKRCYNEGYKKGHDERYAAGYKEGEQSGSYEKGYSKGEADAKKAEQEKGYQAGYKAGFAEKEKQLRDSMREESEESVRNADEPQGTDEYGSYFSDTVWADKNMTAIRYNFTPEEQKEYQSGYDYGYRRAYDEAFSKAKKQGYDETYLPAYNSAYQFTHQNSYREGFGEGKDKGFQYAYQNAYDEAYNDFYYQNKNLEYSYERTRGYQDGLPKGKTEGYNTAVKNLYDKGYKEAYDKTSAAVYPKAYAEGKAAGIDACDKHYHANAVLELKKIGICDESSDLVYKTGENFGITVEVVNYGFKEAGDLSVKLSTTCKSVTIQNEFKADSVPGRKTSTFEQMIGKVNDDAPTGMTAAIKVELINSGTSMTSQTVKIELFNETQKLGIIKGDSVNIRKGPGTNYSILITLHNGDKVAVISLDKEWYKIIIPDGRTGFVYKPLLTVK